MTPCNLVDARGFYFEHLRQLHHACAQTFVSVPSAEVVWHVVGGEHRLELLVPQNSDPLYNVRLMNDAGLLGGRVVITLGLEKVPSGAGRLD